MQKINYMINQVISKEECTMLKGLAILFIIMLNYCHEFPFATEANEFIWIKDNITAFYRHIFYLDHYIIIDFFSFWGHYGVAIFIFISGYGLVLKYESPNSIKIKPTIFIKDHFIKLFKLMIFGFIANMIVNKYCIGYFFHDSWTILGQLTFLINLIPNSLINPGPYWYLGMIMQLYILYVLVLYKKNNSLIFTILCFCFLIQAFCNPNGNYIYWLRRNFIGNYLPFALGILYARYSIHFSNTHTNIIFMIILPFIIFISSYIFIIWIIIPVLIIPFSIGLIHFISKSDSLSSIFYYIGKISAAIFITHSIVHWLLLPAKVDRPNVYYYLLLYLCLCIIIGYAYNQFLKYSRLL